MNRRVFQITTGFILGVAASVAAVAGVIDYTYDQANRLARVQYSGGTVATFQYDNANNLTDTKTMTDSDNDGLPDAWEIEMFGNLSHNGTTDTDGDGMSDYAEFLAGTDPRNASSVLRFLDGGYVDVTNRFVIKWPSATNRLYSLRWAQDSTQQFAVLAADIVATPPTNTFVHTSTVARAYYKILLQGGN